MVFTIPNKCWIISIIFFVVFTCVKARRTPIGQAGYELGDYRLKSGTPYISIYEHENHRGKVHHQAIRKECSNLPPVYDDWASSMITHQRCVTLCEHRDCQGECVTIYPNNKGPKRLKDFRMNDKASSLKYCYTG